MYVEQVPTGGDKNFGYVIADEDSRQAALVDPSYAPGRLVERIAELGYALRYVLITHDHFDHTNGNEAVTKATGAKIVMHKGAPSRPDVAVGDGDTLELGSLTIRTIHTPGHTPDSVCYLVEDALFTGDTLFVGKVGGTDLSMTARQEYESLHRKIMTLPPDTRIYPGHDVGVQPTSTVRHERETNPFLLQPDLDAFVDLKKNWAEYKQKHGIA